MSQSNGEDVQVDEDVLVRESSETHLSLFGERMRSVRNLLEEAFEEEMKKAVEPDATGKDEEQRIPVVPIRFRGSSIGAPAHDVFGDAVQSIFQQLLSRGAPPEFSHWFAYYCATEIDKDLGNIWRNIKFNSDVYSTEGTIEAKRLFIDRIWAIVDKLLLQSKEQEPILGEKWSGIHVSADQLKGRRQKQEDRFVAYPNGRYINHGDDKVALLAIFDGHGGSECSQYSAAHLWEEWSAARSVFGDYIEQSLTSAIASLDERMTKRSEREHWKGGTTAVFCAIDSDRKELSFAWLGDSSGFIMNTLEFRKVTRDHTPSDPEEAKRVEQDGGQLFVIGGELRVNGVLNVTRALGDVMGRPMISNVPESKRISVNPDDYLVVLTCDGITDVLSEEGLYNAVQTFVNEYQAEDYHMLAEHICKEAFNEGSSDNLTVVVGFLRHPTELWHMMEELSDDEDDGGIVEEKSDL